MLNTGTDAKWFILRLFETYVFWISRENVETIDAKLYILEMQRKTLKPRTLLNGACWWY